MVFRIFFLLFLIAVTACVQPKSDEVLAVYGDQKITVGEFKQNLQRDFAGYSDELQDNPGAFAALKKRSLQEMIDRRLLYNRAVQSGTDVNDEEFTREVMKFKNQYTEMNFQKMLQEAGIPQEEWLERKRKNLIIKKYLDRVSDEQHPMTRERILAYYDAHPEAFRQKEAVRVRQIVTDSKEKAEAILRRLRNGENFAKLARDLSLSPDRKQGGDLGFIVKGSFPREFELCFQMNPGEISPIIPSSYGFHLFKVIEKRPETTLVLEQVEGKIAMQLKLQWRDETRKALLDQIKRQTPVEINEKILARIKI